MPDRMQELFTSLNSRRRPEDIAARIQVQLKGKLQEHEESTLQTAVRGALGGVYRYTSMRQDFARPAGMQRQVTTAYRLFPDAPQLEETVYDDPQAVETLVHAIEPQIGKTFGLSDFQGDRLSHATRKASGITISRRQYNKRFRHLMRMEQKLATLQREWKKHEFTKIGKSALASRLAWEEFNNDEDTGCFIAYYTARCNLRSEFTISGQQKPYDQIADMLFRRCREKVSTNWWAIAHVYPVEEVLDHLSDAQKGELLGRWFSVLQEIAGLLEEVWEYSRIDRKTMVVRRGNDSTTWNNTANAWNRARDGWIALLYAMGADNLLDAMCVGKVLGLMAADVVMWHKSAGGDLHPDTPVWNELPLPWQVLLGEVVCTRAMVEQVCRKYHVDPIKSGWTAPKPRSKAVPFRPTPELVHGVTVTNPYLATILRRAGYFSGKAAGQSVHRPNSASLN